MKETPAAAAIQKDERSSAAQGALTLLWCLYGLLVPRALLYGEMAPFGISLAAAVQTGGVPVIIATLAGYLLAGDMLYPLRYLTAVAMVAGGRWVLAAVPEWRRHPVTGAILAFVATLSTGLLLLGQTGMDGYRVLLTVAESAVAAGCTLFFFAAVRWVGRYAAVPTDKQDTMTHTQQAAVILTGAVGVMAVSSLSVGGFAPGRAVAVLLTLVLARTGREAGGCMAGVILGAAIALSAPGQTIPAMAMAAGGLAAGVFSRFGKLPGAAAFFLAGGVVTLMEVDKHALMYIYEIFAAGVLFVLLPRPWDHALSHLFIRSREEPAVEGLRTDVAMRLGVAARALCEVSDTVEAVACRLARHSPSDMAAVLSESCRTVCSACPLYAACWEQHREELLGALDALVPLLRQAGRVEAEDLSGYPRQNCRQKGRLTEQISRRYEQHLTQETAWQRLAELRGALRDQFGATGELLTALAKDMESPRQVDTALSARVLTVCGDYGMPVKAALCTRGRGNRLTVEILTEDVGVRTDKGRWLRDMQRACARSFATPTVTPCGEDVRITLTERARYRLEVGQAQLCCDGEKLCGDAVDRFLLQGEMVVMLSDGMGSGGRAAVDGAMAVGLCSRLWQAGFSADSILKTVNAAMMVKSREESLATLDVVVIDTFSGRLDSFKAGAAASLLRSKGRVSRLERPSLPVGILPDVVFSHSHDWLVSEDVLLLCSDGAFPQGVAAVETMLLEHQAGESMQSLAEKVASAAREAQGDHQDDVTVVAIAIRS